MSGSELARAEAGGALARTDEIYLGVPVEQIVARVEKIQQVQTRVMKRDHHYGEVPGTKGKPSLFKPGAELLCLTFQLAPDFTTEDRWDGDHLECVVKCVLEHGPTGVKVGSGLGSCSTRESKYAYRNGKRKCPQCGSEAALNKSKRDPGFYCWARAGGCGATFGPDDKRITEQQVGRVPNPDLADQYNTVRKMACKRALVAAVLITCGASELFTQDVEDMPRNDGGGDDGGWDGGGPPGPGYDGYGYGDGRDESPPRQQQGRGQQRGNGQRLQNGDRPDDNRGRSSGGNGADPEKSAEATARMLEAFAGAKTADALDELAPELNILKNEQALTVADYRKLRDAYSARARELKGSARQSA